MAGLDLGLEQRVGADAPVAGHGEQMAAAARIAHLRVEVGAAALTRTPKAVAVTEALAQVDGAGHVARLAPGRARRGAAARRWAA